MKKRGKASSNAHIKQENKIQTIVVNLIADFYTRMSSGTVVKAHDRFAAPLVRPVTGMVMISRTELITVMIPTYRSPPYLERVALQTICTDPFVIAIINPASPRAQISFTNRKSSFI